MVCLPAVGLRKAKGGKRNGEGRESIADFGVRIAEWGGEGRRLGSESIYKINRISREGGGEEHRTFNIEHRKLNGASAGSRVGDGCRKRSSLIQVSRERQKGGRFDCGFWNSDCGMGRGGKAIAERINLQD